MCPFLSYAERILAKPDAFHKRMFGADAVYWRGKLVLVATDGDEPWNGLLFPVEKPLQASVCAEFPELKPHSILGKWLYLPARGEAFERLAVELVGRIESGDERFGTVPKPRKSKKKAKETQEQSAPVDKRPPHLR